METASQESGGESAAPTYPILAIIWRSFWLSLLSFSPALLIAILFVFLRSSDATASTPANAAASLPFIVLVVFVPMYETAIFQLAVIELLLKAKVKRAIYILPIAAIAFIAVHFTNPRGVGSGISVIPAGFILAYCYLYWRRRAASWRVASMATWLTHSFHNFYFWLLKFVPASLIFG